MTKSARKENPVHAARHCLMDLPYRAVVYVGMDKDTPLYAVAGSEMAPSGAIAALREAHRIHHGKCFYCNKPVGRKNLSIDHAEAVAAGGKNNLQNLLIAHKACNQKKGQMPIEAFDPRAGREWLSALLTQVRDRLNRLEG